MQICSFLPVKNNLNIKETLNSNNINLKQNLLNKYDVGSLNILSKYNQRIISFGVKNIELFDEMSKHLTNSEQDREKRKELFLQTTQTVQDNINETTDKFKDEGLVFDKYLQACIKQLRLFYIKPKTIESNVKNLVERFKDEGLTVEQYLTACVKQPPLFCQSPDTIENNVRNLVERFKDEELTVEQYLPACIRKPQLFCQLPDTIENNVRNLVERFKGEGLTVEQYLPVCLRQPQLFCHKPDNVEKNVRNLVKKFTADGLAVRNYLPSCIRQPQLFYQSPDTIGKHIDILRFIEKDNNFHNNISVSDKYILQYVIKYSNLCNSNYKYYTLFLREKMFGEAKPKELKGRENIQERMKEYLKNNSDKKYSFDVINDKITPEFIEFTKQLSLETSGRDDMFEISVINQ